ncbi:MAG: vWA domain-containing protein [archaeon]
MTNKNETLETRTEDAWKTAMDTWNQPSIPSVITAKNYEEMKKLGIEGEALSNNLAFMKYPEFQTYANLQKITEEFNSNPQKGLNAILTHEAGHRFCPYDTITSLLLTLAAKKELDKQKLPYSSEAAAPMLLNLFTDMCINTKLAQNGDENIAWAYNELSKGKACKSKLWRVYAKSMEISWNQKIIPDNLKLSREEEEGAKQAATLFEKDFFYKSNWQENIMEYAGIMAKFLENPKRDGKGGKNGKSGMDDISKNMPKKGNISEKTAEEIAKRMSGIGADGVPQNEKGLEEFREIMAGLGYGDKKKASVMFYDALSNAYDVMFATKPFGTQRQNPFQPVKWNPSMSMQKLDINYSTNAGGRVIPGVNTYTWNTRKRQINTGIEEVVPNLELYLDSSGSMPNPIDEMSLPVLAGFVVAKKANKKGASIKVNNFSDGYETTAHTRELDKVFDGLVRYFEGGTTFPTEEILAKADPKQVLVITDGDFSNPKEAAEAIRELKNRNSKNNVVVYAINSGNASYLKEAGAEVIYGSNTDIFKKVIGKGEEVYSR